jgi:N-methylhydantoinase A/oxoprolinase/acetone carboxylase beta subunit
VIAFDMGGTSTDVTLLDGRLPVTTESAIDDSPIRLPMIDIETVGAGGGSIVYVDAGGALRVGPQSAGAVPGPACYGTGDELTVTDANLLLGRMDAPSFLGGRLTLDCNRALQLAQKLAARLDMNESQLAEGIVRIANSNMERALRVVSVQRGHDPRDFALVAFGGAGGMHACDLAESLDIETVLVPKHAGVLSAFGMLVSDYTKHYSRSVLRSEAEISLPDLEHLFEPLLAEATRDLHSEGFTGEAIQIDRSLDIRNAGQSYEITLPFSADYRNEFDARHHQLYGYSNPERTIEIVNVRVKAVGLTQKFGPRREIAQRTNAHPQKTRQTVFGGEALETAVFSDVSLKPGMQGHGPAIIAGGQSTTVIPPDWRFTVDAQDTLILTKRSGASEGR